MNKFTGRFSGKAQDYVKYRPKYPLALKKLLIEKLNLSSDKIVADIGSGTGISSEFFIENGNTVFAVEPNDDMRELAEHLFENSPNFISINATAEQTTLEDQSIDLIFAGTAFHWFDVEKTKTEFNRILKADGNMVIAWNNRDLDDEFQKTVEEIFDRYLPKIEGTEEQKYGKNIAEFFAPKIMHQMTTNYTQSFDLEQFLGRLHSSSYFPKQGDEIYDDLTKEMTEAFEKFQKDGTVDFNYKTQIYWS